jgi:hypothetical protein
MQSMVRLWHGSATRIALCLVWGLGIISALYQVTVYSYTSEDVRLQPRLWPEDTKLALASDRPTMLFTLHPRCVCSRASLAELAGLLAKVPSRVRVQILIYQPSAASNSWAESDLALQARSIPGVAVLADADGGESRRFGMSVSGHTAIYAPDGRLLFSGGITRARGHAGDNAGRSAIISLLSNRPAATARTPVFGCSIFDRG